MLLTIKSFKIPGDEAEQPTKHINKLLASVFFL